MVTILAVTIFSGCARWTVIDKNSALYTGVFYRVKYIEPKNKNWYQMGLKEEGGTETWTFTPIEPAREKQPIFRRSQLKSKERIITRDDMIEIKRKESGYKY